MLIIDNILLPVNCVVCESITNNKSAICDSCTNLLKKVKNNNCCPKCGAILNSNHFCTCNDRYVYYDYCYSLYHYESVMRKIIFSYKTSSVIELSNFFTDNIVKKVNAIFKKGNYPDYITFIPITRKKRYMRGFNQSSEIAKKVGKKLNIEVLPLLKDNGSIQQKSSNYNERFLNIIDRYGLIKKNTEKIDGKDIIIIDDIFTTGATLNECSRVLRRFNVKKIFVITLATAVND